MIEYDQNWNHETKVFFFLDETLGEFFEKLEIPDKWSQLKFLENLTTETKLSIVDNIIFSYIKNISEQLAEGQEYNVIEIIQNYVQFNKFKLYNEEALKELDNLDYGND
jgi:hypothetical protein